MLRLAAAVLARIHRCRTPIAAQAIMNGTVPSIITYPVAISLTQKSLWLAYVTWVTMSKPSRVMHLAPATRAVAELIAINLFA
jgi:hypothetical protein